MTTDRRAREYELVYILKGTATAAAAEKVAERIRDVVGSRNGKLLRVDNWGRRRLAYPIAKSTRGVFVYLRLVGWNDLVAELERNLRLLDDVVRFQTVLINERVDLEGYQVDPEEVEFRPIEEAGEDEEEPELAQRLGLVERPREPSNFEAAEEGGEIDAAEIGASAEGGAEAPAPEAAPAAEGEAAKADAEASAESTEEPS
ncbi:MAG: 30S ribosomal protein S6 [Myxococcales bacterium]|nr:30S ribosomal protein S6 [Myxococcales bacterium]